MDKQHGNTFFRSALIDIERVHVINFQLVTGLGFDFRIQR